MNDWRKVKLSAITTQIRGVSYGKEDVSEFSKDGYLPVLRANNISTGGKLNYENLVYVAEKRISKTQIIKKGDIIVAASSGSKDIVGKAAISKIDWSGGFGAFCKLIRPKDVCAGFLGFYFQTPNYRRVISNLSEGANINNLRNEHFDNLEIPLPDLATQKHIAEVLDKADALRQQNRQLLAHYDGLLQSTFIELFGDPVKNPKGWEMRKLGDICNKITDGTHKTPNYQPIGVKFISAKNIKNGEIDWTDLKYISEEEHYLLFKRCNPEYGDVLITKSGSIGMCAIVKENSDFSLFESLALIKLKEQLVNRFFRELINLNDLVKQFIKGAGVKHLHLTDLRNLKIPLPPLLLQQHFAKIVEQIELQKEQTKTALDESDALFEGLLAKFFN